jgi:23S rRNA (uracil1939-C5)-methyltransferase
MDQGVVFVPLTAPGDIVSLREIRKRRGVHFAELDELIESSAQRRDPPCPWFGRCGGCQWMHMDYGSQVRWKEDIFKQALRGIAHLKEVPSIRVHSSPDEFQYRFRARLQIKGLVVGFYRRGSNSIVPWERCMLLPEALNSTVRDLRGWLRDNGAHPTLKSCEVALSPVDGSITLNWLFTRAKGTSGSARMVMDGMEEITGDKKVHLAGQAAHDDRGKTISVKGTSLPLEVGGIRMAASPGTFFQVNPEVNKVLVKRALAHLQTKGSRSLLDLYCGNGNFNLPAGAAGIKTVGVESSPGAILDALSASAPDNRFIEMDITRFLEQNNTESDAVIFDPPRTGLPREVAKLLGSKRFPCLIYVSCEPSTLARDLARLTEAGYVISDIELFDMFPQTFHSEVLVVMRG